MERTKLCQVPDWKHPSTPVDVSVSRTSPIRDSRNERFLLNLRVNWVNWVFGNRASLCGPKDFVRRSAVRFWLRSEGSTVLHVFYRLPFVASSVRKRPPRSLRPFGQGGAPGSSGVLGILESYRV